MHICIIGAGLVGLSTAFSLQKGGHAITVVERRDEPGLETSFANGGLLTPSMSQPWNAPGIHRALIRSFGRSNASVLLRARALPTIARWGIAFLRESRPDNYARNAARNFRLAQYSLRVMDEMAAELALDSLVHRTGVLNLYRDAQELQAGLAEATALAPEGLKWNTLDGSACVEHEPLLEGVEPQIAGGIFFPEDRSGDAHGYCGLLAAAIRRAGARFLLQTTVVGWRKGKRRVSAARSTQGDIAADCFVIAAGSYTPRLARDLGIYVPIYPAKGYSLSLDGSELPQLPRVPVLDSSLHAAVATIGKSLRIAGTVEFTGFDLAVSAERVRNLESMLSQVYPHLAKRSEQLKRTAWAGLRPMSSDGVPIIGGTRIENVYLNSGHGHLGWTLAAGSGALLAQLMTGRARALDHSDYAIERFRRKADGRFQA